MISLFIEFAEFGLGEVLGWDISSTLMVKIAIEAAQAMRYLNRDLKVENIMLNSVYETKLVDFGLVRISECVLGAYSLVKDSLTPGVGTLAYMSSEMLNEEECDSSTDVCSFCVVLHNIFIGGIHRQSMKNKVVVKIHLCLFHKINMGCYPQPWVAWGKEF